MLNDLCSGCHRGQYCHCDVDFAEIEALKRELRKEKAAMKAAIDRIPGCIVSRELEVLLKS